MSGLSRIIQHHIPLANKHTYYNTVYMCVQVNMTLFIPVTVCM